MAESNGRGTVSVELTKEEHAVTVAALQSRRQAYTERCDDKRANEHCASKLAAVDSALEKLGARPFSDAQYASLEEGRRR